MLLMQLRMLLVFLATRTHCWPLATSVSTRTAKSFSVKLLLSQPPPAYNDAWNYSSPAEDLAFPFVECYEIPLCPFSALSGSLCMEIQPSAALTVLLHFVLSLRSFRAPFSDRWYLTIHVITTTRPIISPQILPTDWLPARLRATDHNPLSPAIPQVSGPPHYPLTSVCL